jgi:hypothetical protein
MSAKSGDQHHRKAKMLADQQALLGHLEQGIEPQVAVGLIGRNPGTLREWLRKPQFAAKIEAAREEGARRLQAVAGDVSQIPFSKFSEEFLGSKVFPHHQAWVDVLEGREPSWQHEAFTYTAGHQNRLLINVPPEHAKSTVLTVGYATYRIALNPNIRIVIVSQTQTRAKEFLFAIKQRLTEPAWARMQQVFGPPEGYKATADQWTQDRIYLERTSGEKDPTVQAIGMGQQIYGTRADLIILDDCVTTTNAHEWTKQLEWLQKMVITRLGKNGKLVIVGTRISAIDLYREIRNPDHWAGGKTPFTYLAMPAVLEFHDKPEKWVTLWPRSDRPWDGDEDLPPDEDGLWPKWDGQALKQRRSEVTSSTWALVYQQQDIEEDAIFNPTLVNAVINRMRKPGPLKIGAAGHPREGQWVRIMGLDPAMAGKTAAIMYAVERTTGKRLILDAHNMSDPTPQKIRALIETWVQAHQPAELRIEINAFQKAFALDDELRQWLSNRGCRLMEHFTGKNKWDTSFGVASMADLLGSMRDSKFQNDNQVELPDTTNNEHIKALITQMITWKPDTKNPTDLIMAWWFCEIRAKELIQQGTSRQTHAHNRFLSRRAASTQTIVRLSDLAADVHYI